MRREEREDGVCVAVAGQSRWGKTTWVKSRIAGAARVLVWDVRGEYLADGFTAARSIPELAGLLRESWMGPARIAYWGSLADFPEWCGLAYAWVQLWPCVAVAEEVADVTTTAKAMGPWGDLVRKGLFYGLHLYAVTQRPQETDKSLWGNATCLHSHGFIAAPDRRYMADRLGCDVSVLDGLNPGEWVERWQGRPELVRGRIEAPAGA